MKLYICILLFLVLIFWGNTLALLWVGGISLFIPIKYAKDFIDKRLS